MSGMVGRRCERGADLWENYIDLEDCEINTVQYSTNYTRRRIKGR